MSACRHTGHYKTDLTSFVEEVLGLCLTPFQVRFLSLLEKQKKSTRRRASNDYPSVSVDMNRFDIRAISATRATSGAISVEEER